jgi:hypothetical protein
VAFPHTLRFVLRPAAPHRTIALCSAGGALDCASVRGGRLSGRSHGSCDAAAARRHLAGTPPEWTGFAQRNAELAARLAADGGAGSPESIKDQIHPDERTRGSSLR